MITHFRTLLGTILPILLIYGTSNSVLTGDPVTPLYPDKDRSFHSVLTVHEHTLSHRFVSGSTSQNSISDFVWEDANMDGIQNPGEDGIGNVTVKLYPDDNEDGNPDQSQPIKSTTTNSSGQVGYYQIDQIPDGSYVVEFIPPSGYYITPSHQGDNDLKDSDINSSGYTQTIELGTTDCRKVEDEDLQSNGIIGETEYIIEYDEEGEPHSVSFYGGDIIDITIKGGPDTAHYDEPPFVDLKAPINPNNGKHYAISNFILCYKMQDLTAIDAGFYRKASLEGTVWFDQNENGDIETASQNEYGFEQWTVTLKQNGTTINSISSSSTGHYSFQNLNPGTYTVQVNRPSGHQPTYDPDGVNTPDQAQTNLISNEDKNQFRFGYVGTCSIGNLLWVDENGNEQYDNNEPVLEEIPVIIDRADRPYRDTFYTGTNGIYQIPKLTAGTYKITVEEPQGYVPYYDEDGVSTPNQITTSLSIGDHHMTADFAYIEQGSALPVRWVSFSAFLTKQNTVRLQWIVEEEDGCDYYEIQRSENGAHWTSIGKREVIEGSRQQKTYQFTDAQPNCDFNYYRIRQTDHNGHSSISEIRQITYQCGEDVRISPNPAHSHISISIPSEYNGKRVRIYSMDGRLQLNHAMSSNPQSQRITLDISDLHAGQYYLFVLNQDNEYIGNKLLMIRP